MRKDYDVIKVFVWRFIRVFLAAFIAQISLMNFDWTNPKLVYTSLLAAGISAFAKVVRDEIKWTRLPL